MDAVEVVWTTHRRDDQLHVVADVPRSIPKAALGFRADGTDVSSSSVPPADLTGPSSCPDP